MDGRRKRGTAKHAGVVLKRRVLPSGAISWRARLVDPDTGESKYETLPAEDAATEERRATWAVRRAEKLHERSTALAGGAAVKTGRSVEDVVEQYFKDNGERLRDRTVTTYRVATSELVEFAKERRITSADDLLSTTLAALRAWTLARPRKGADPGAGKAARRSVVTANQRLRGLRTVLTELRRNGLVPMLTSDAIKDGLRAEKEPRSVPAPLKSHEIPRLLRAAMRHDAAMFKITREENRAGGTPGSTPKHEPVAPFVLFMLCTGMRRDEARTLRWDRVDLQHQPAGAIHLRAGDVKTGRARLVDLKVSPTLQQLLTGMQLRAGDRPFVFGVDRESKDGEVTNQPWTEEETKNIYERLERDYSAPKFNWMKLRDTAATYLVNASVFGDATIYRAAKMLGHSVAVCESKYCDVVNVEPADTIEAAMSVEAEVRSIVKHACGERLTEEDVLA